MEGVLLALLSAALPGLTLLSNRYNQRDHVIVVRVYPAGVINI